MLGKRMYEHKNDKQRAKTRAEANAALLYTSWRAAPLLYIPLLTHILPYDRESSPAWS